MIDHFTREELLSFEYAVISASIKVQGGAPNVAKINMLYPDLDLITEFSDLSDKKEFKKSFYEDLEQRGNVIYKVFIVNLLAYKNICIICDETENFFIDVLVDFLKDKFAIETIDLNKLFKEGRVGKYYINRKEIHNKAVDIRREAVKDRYKSLESSEEGRLNLLNMMEKKAKIKKLRSLGINVTKSDYQNLDQLLMEGWVTDEND
jgi:hypothetical protein